MRNQVKDEVDNPQTEAISADTEATSQLNDAPDFETSVAEQRDLFSQPAAASTAPSKRITARSLNVSIRLLADKDLNDIDIGEALIGLGFEDRTLAASQHLAGLAHPKLVRAVRYSMEGHALAIVDAWRRTGISVVETNYSDFRADFPQSTGLMLVDISGLTKPLIFNSIRKELIAKGRVLVCHASALTHYPLQEDLGQLLEAKKLEDTSTFLEQLSKVLTGEKGPYKAQSLIDESTDPTRSRALLAFASPKHERLFSLLDRREFDQIEIVTSSGTSSRAQVSGFAADFIAKNYVNSVVTKVDTDDLDGLVRYLDQQYLNIYSEGGANLEIGLTGSKIQAVASAILSSRRKISQAWYVSPREFDEKRFSTGVGKIRIFDIALRD